MKYESSKVLCNNLICIRLYMKEGFLEHELISIIIKYREIWSCIIEREFSDVSAGLESIFSIMRFWGDLQDNIILKKTHVFSITTPNLTQRVLPGLHVVSYCDQSNCLAGRVCLFTSRRFNSYFWLNQLHFFKLQIQIWKFQQNLFT